MTKALAKRIRKLWGIQVGEYRIEPLCPWKMAKGWGYRHRQNWAREFGRQPRKRRG